MREKLRGDKLIGVLYGALILSPLVILLVQSLIHGMNLFKGVPTWSDELDYYREMLSYSHNGLKFGGSLFAGHEAAIGPFGAHSFSPVIAWGIVSLFGWNEHSILLFNLFFLCFSFLIFVLALKPRGRRLVLSFAAAYLYAPLVLYLHTSMIEVVIYGWIIIYFSLFSLYLSKKTRGFFALALAAGIIVTLLRMPYVVVLFPLIWAASDYKFNLKTLKNLIIYILLFLVVYKVYNMFCADYPDWVTSRLAARPGLWSKFKFIINNVFTNLRLYFTFSATPVQWALRYAYGITIVLLLAASFVEKGKEHITKCFKRDYFALFIMTGGLWAIMVALYDIKDYRDFRTFSIVLFFVYLYVFIGSNQKEAGPLQYIFVALMLFICAFSFKEGLIQSRNTVTVAETDDSFAVLNTPDAGSKSIGATFDINWGGVGLLKSIPGGLGYKVILEAEIESFTGVDYVLTTDEYLSGHPELKERLEFMFETEASYLVFKVK